MSKYLLHILVAGSLAFSVAHAQLPDREAFGKIERAVEQVPLSAFQLDPELGKDLKLEVWAQSPLLFSPVAMDVDPQGRIWLTEGIDYNQRPRVSNGQSIIVVTDSDGDGKADKSHIFVSEPKISPEARRGNRAYPICPAAPVTATRTVPAIYSKFSYSTLDQFALAGNCT